MRRVTLGFLALSALVVQNTALVFAMKYSYRSSAKKYSEASVILSSEVVKLFVCSGVIISQNGGKYYSALISQVPAHAYLAVPSVLYVLQNYLLFVAVRHLSTTLYVVCTQGKTITTAIFSFFMLGTPISLKKGLSMLLLMFGVFLVQAASNKNAESVALPNADLQPQLVGLLSVFIAVCTSGFAGVFLEKHFKSSAASIWDRNVHLSLLSLPMSIVGAVLQTRRSDEELFQGHDFTVVVLVVLQACGGLITAIVMRHASSILKCFAVSISICVCAVISCLLGQDNLSSTRILGVVFVTTAVFSFAGAK